MLTQFRLKPKKKRTYETWMDNIKTDLKTRFGVVAGRHLALISVPWPAVMYMLMAFASHEVPWGGGGDL
jgi:hypothetical protein